MLIKGNTGVRGGTSDYDKSHTCRHDIYSHKCEVIGQYNGLSPVWHQVIIYTYADDAFDSIE